MTFFYFLVTFISMSAPLHFLFVLGLALMVCSTAPAQAREESPHQSTQKADPGKIDKGWVRRELTRRKKGLALLKKVKDEASASALIEQFREIWGVDGTPGTDGWFIDEKLTFADPMPSSISGEEVYDKAGKQLLKISAETDKVLQKLCKKGLMNDELNAAATMLFYSWDK